MNLYIPIVSKLSPSIVDGKLKEKPSFTLLSINKIPKIKNRLPSNEDIVEHLFAQRKILNAGGKFSSIKIKLEEDTFEDLVQEIKSKLNCKNHKFQSIDLVVNLKSYPLIQFIKN